VYCIVCNQQIGTGESIFWGTQMVCAGLGESDCDYSNDPGGLIGAVCSSCLKSPTAAAVDPNRVVPESVDEELIVTRSDALSIFEGIV
jgi:hypothetical protein